MSAVDRLRSEIGAARKPGRLTSLTLDVWRASNRDEINDVERNHLLTLIEAQRGSVKAGAFA